MIDFHASEPQYADHLLPIWLALPARERGRWFHMGRLRSYLLAIGVEPAALAHGKPGRGGPIVVASIQDLMMAGARDVVMVNHGAGQTYRGDTYAARHPSYTGGEGRERVVLHVCPSERDADACQVAQPDVPAVAVGCPKLDQAHRHVKERDVPPVVCVSFHFPLKLCPETFWAFPHYEVALRELAADRRRGFELIGHGHPRAFAKLRRFYDDCGIEAVEHFGEVLARADLYVCDNSSTIYEFASTGRPVLLMNAPWYRREVEHGLRFWADADVGVQVDDGTHLRGGIIQALIDTPEQAALREMVVSGVYRHRDGRAAERAAQAILQATAGLPDRSEMRRAVDSKRARR